MTLVLARGVCKTERGMEEGLEDEEMRVCMSAGLSTSFLFHELNLNMFFL